MTAAGRKLQRLGSAAIVIRLGDGPTIIVTREDDGTVLLVAQAGSETWASLWAVLESFRTDDE